MFTMLETVKTLIEDGPFIYESFKDYFSNYVCLVQDALIEEELKHIEKQIGSSNYNDLIVLMNKEPAVI